MKKPSEQILMSIKNMSIDPKPSDWARFVDWVESSYVFSAMTVGHATAASTDQIRIMQGRASELKELFDYLRNTTLHLETIRENARKATK